MKQRKTNPLHGYNYSDEGLYFITTCTKNKLEWFGKINNGEMKLNEYGRIVNNQWLWLEKHFTYVRIGVYVIMPNHFHGIIMIDDIPCRDNPRIVPTKAIPITIYNRRHNLLSKTINAFKSTSSKLIHHNGELGFQWQRSFHDHIIRNEKSLNTIQQYIIDNPLKWKFDEENIINIRDKNQSVFFG